MTGLTSDDIRSLSKVFAAAGWSSLRLRIGGDTLELSVDSSHVGSDARPATTAATAPGAEASSSLAKPVLSSHERAKAVQDQPVDEPDRPASNGATGSRETITAPNLGTFYAAPSPGEPPYVQVGQRIEAGDEVALIEVMKLYTPVRSQVSGTVVEVLASDGQLVEFGEPLVVVDTGAV